MYTQQSGRSAQALSKWSKEIRWKVVSIKPGLKQWSCHNAIVNCQAGPMREMVAEALRWMYKHKILIAYCWSWIFSETNSLSCCWPLDLELFGIHLWKHSGNLEKVTHILNHKPMSKHMKVIWANKHTVRYYCRYSSSDKENSIKILSRKHKRSWQVIISWNQMLLRDKSAYWLWYCHFGSPITQ